jgi:hypothetical protein
MVILALLVGCSNPTTQRPVPKQFSSEQKMTAQANQVKPIISIDPVYVTAFRAAAAERKIDLKDDNLAFSETDRTYIVEAIDTKKDPDQLGSDPDHLDCNAEIEKKTKRLLRFWYSR